MLIAVLIYLLLSQNLREIHHETSFDQRQKISQEFYQTCNASSPEKLQ